MELSTLYQGLSAEYRQGQLLISSEQYELTFRKVFRQLYESELVITMCTLNYYDNYIEIKGKSAISLLYKGNPVDIQILCYQKNEDIWCQLKLSITDHCKIEDFFSNISGSRVAQSAQYIYTDSILKGIVFKYPEITTDSDHIYNDYPFSIKAGISFPSDTWNNYVIFTLGAVIVSGKVALKDNFSYYSTTKFELDVPLKSKINDDDLKDDILKDATLLIKLYSGLANQYDSDFMQSLSGADLVFHIEMQKIVTPIDFSMALFDVSNIWQMNAGFEKGFALSDAVNTILHLLNVNNLYLPSNTPLDFLKLYYLGMRFVVEENNNRYMDGMKLIVASSEPWVLPIPFIRLQNFAMAFETSYSNTQESIYSGEISGTVALDFGETMLSLSVKATVPDMELSGSLVWADNDWGKPAESVTLTNLLTPFKASAPNQTTGASTLARLDVCASFEQRTFSVSADIKDIFKFTIGRFEVNLAEILVEGTLSAAILNASIYGVMAFGDRTSSNYFELDAKAAYLTGEWKFEGGLKTGVVSISSVLEQIFSIDEGQIADNFLDIKLTQLQLSFDSKGNQYSILAAFQMDWNIFKQDFSVKAKLQLRRTSNNGDLYAAAMFALSIGMFQVIVQANDFYSTNYNYLFRIQYDKLYLQAIYANEKHEEEYKEILTISMGGMTLGGLVEIFVDMWNPNAHFKLSSPWNLLNKIDLSKFQLVLNVTDETAAFYYQVNLNILGLMEVEKVGIQYRTDGISTEKKIFFVVTGKLLDQNYTEDDPLSWDAVDEKPPEASALNQKAFSLYYLGVGQHLKNEDARGAKDLKAALKALKGHLIPPKNGEVIPAQVQYDADMNWLFGAEFKIDALRMGIVLNDPIMYGLMITVEQNTGALAAFSGLYLELLYKKITEDISMFKAVLMLPDKFRTIQLGVVTIKLGLVSFEIYTNGNFYIDLGFPYNADFTNSFVLEVYIFTGHGGIYFGVLTGVPSKSVPQVTNGAFSTVILLGVGLAFGLGRSFDLGIAKGGLSLEVFGIFEGVLAFFECKDDNKQYLYYYASATVGIVGRLYLSVDFKVIKISASAEIKAYASLTLESYKALIIALDLLMELKASVKVLFIKVKFSYTFKKHIEFKMGSDSTPPWKLTQPTACNKLSREVMFELADTTPIFLEDLLSTGERKTISVKLLPFFSVENPIVQIAPPTQGAKAWNSIPMKNRASAAKMTANETGFCVAFLPLLDVDNQKTLIGLLSEWLLSRWNGDQITFDPQFVPNVANQLTYDLLFTFLQNSAFFKFDLSTSIEQEGAAFPMLPPLTLGWNPQNTPDGAKTMIHYWQESLVSVDYANMLTEYFKNLNPDPTYQPMVGGVEDGNDIPLAQLIFLDYFQMALRELIGQIVSFFDQFDCIIGNKKYPQEAWEQIINDNPNLAFTSGELVFPQYAYVVKQGETLDRIAEKLGITYSEILTGCGGQTMLLRQGAEVNLSAYQFNNQVSQLPLKLVAALFYVRYFEFDLENEYQDYSAQITKINPNFPIIEEIIDLNHPAISLPMGGSSAGIQWRPLMGDTLTRLGKMCAFYEMETGTNSNWDQFLSTVADASGIITIPLTKTSVNGDLTLEMLLRRVFPEQMHSAWVKSLIGSIFTSDMLVTFANVALINVPYTVKQKPDSSEETAKDILNNMSATFKELAAALAADNSRVDQSQQILLTNQDVLPKQDVLDQLIAVETNSLPAMLSRFLLQGLRIPNPWPKEVAGKLLLKDYVDSVETLPLFETMKQQVPYVFDTNNWELTCYGGQDGCNWVDTTAQTRTFTGDEIRNELPAQQITMGINAPQKLPDFLKTMPCYPIGSQLPWQNANRADNSVLNILPATLSANLEQIALELQGKTAKGISITSQWGTYMPIQIQKSELGSNIYPLFGANAQDRLLLRELLNGTPDSVHLLYKPSLVSGIPEGLVEDSWSLKKSGIIKSNLSVETQMRRELTVIAPDQIEPKYLYSANLEKINIDTFLQLLWECSVVGGGGYHIVLENSNGESLPDNLFDEEGNGYLYLLALYSGYPQNRKPVNCTVTSNAQTQGESLTYYEQFDETRQEYQVAFPVGCVGVRLETDIPPGNTDPEENLTTSDNAMITDGVTTPEDRTKQIFHIIGYQIQENDNYDASHDSVPLVPQPGSNEHLWSYTPVLPLYRYVKGSEQFIYGANGKIADIDFELRDILGNKAQIDGFSVSVTPNYNDFLIALHEWPYQAVYYEIIGDAQTPTLSITCEPSADVELKDSLTKLLSNAYCQFMQPGIAVTVNSCFFANGEKSMDISALRGYLGQLLLFAQSKGQKPDQLKMEFPLTTNASQDVQLPKVIFQLSTKIAIVRSGFQTNAVKARIVESNIPPYKDDSDTFVDKLEIALPKLRIAQGDGSNNSLYGLLFGENGAVESIQIKPFQYPNSDNVSITAPEFFALRPLKNQWMSRNCQVFSLDQYGNPVTEYVDKVYSNIDMEIWAIRFLEDVEQMLKQASNWIQNDTCKKTYDDFVEGKRQLAEAITKQLEPLRQEAVYDTTELKKQFKSKLLRSLSDGYQIDLAALYRLSVTSSQNCRMTVSGETEGTDAVLQPGKIDVNNSANSYCMFINAKSDWQAGLSPVVKASIQEIEYDIEDVEGNYQSSKWLKLFHPIKDGDLNAVKLSLSSGIPFPNLLKRCPLPPTIPTHSCTVEDPKTIHDMLRWNYAVECKYESFEQDVLFLNVQFGCRTKNTVKATSKDLFDWLAQYDSIRDDLVDKLSSNNPDIFNNAFKTLLRILQAVGTVWEEWLSNNALQIALQLEERVYECKITMPIQGEPLQITPLNGTEKVLKDLGADDPKVECLNMTGSELRILFSIGNLPIYNCHTATPFVKVVRNADLLKQWQVNETFVYRTEIVSKYQVEAAYMNTDEIIVGRTSLKQLSDYQMMIQNLWNALELNGIGLTMNLGVSYVYGLIQGQKNPAVRLPVTMFLGIAADGSLVNSIAENLHQWYSVGNSETNQAYYLFDVTVYAEDNRRILLHLPQLVYFTTA
ncbi:MAG: LysM domain-containing protein [Desulfosporosinus sp.]|nr:LysM domain-containing protein [Desulfosporosinus sp.]